jgi:hypothetical protein
MKSLKLLAEKYDQVQLTRSEEALIAAQTPEQLLETFQELSQISGDVIVAFEHAITNRSSLIKENTAEQDSDVRVAVLAMEKVLSHLDSGNDKQFCIAFESFARNASLEEGDLDVLTEAKPGFFSKLGKGIKKYAGKAATAVGKGVSAVAKGAGQVAGGLAGGVVGAGKALAQGAKQGYNVAKDVVGGTVPAKASTTPATIGTTPTTNTTGQNITPVVSQTPAPVAQVAQGRVNKGDAEKAVDSVATQIQQVRVRDRQAVVAYAIQKLTAMQKAAPAGQVATPTNTAPVAQPAAAESLVAESVESFYITTNKHFRK